MKPDAHMLYGLQRPQQLSKWCLQHRTQAQQDHQRRIADPALDLRHIGTVDLGAKRQLFLRDAQAVARIPDTITQQAQRGSVVQFHAAKHGGHEIVGLRNIIYNCLSKIYGSLGVHSKFTFQ